MLRALSLATAMLVCLFAGGLAATSASAADTTLTMQSITMAPGGEAALELRASNIPSPGLGAWTIDVQYDPSVVSALHCDTSINDSVCNAAYAGDQVRTAGASAPGNTGDAVLARITFRCDQDGVSPLSIIVTHFADATEGSPNPISFVLHNGSIGCSSPVIPQGDLLGDVDCNGMVNSRDALLVLQYEAALINTLPCQELGDVNQDGQITSVDASLIKQIDAGLIDQIYA